jgi:hypothetical protein
LWSHNLLPNIFQLAVDSNGHVYATGSLNRWVLHDRPLPAGYLQSVGISPEGNGGSYVARFSPAGQLDWVRLLGGVRTLSANKIVVDDVGNYYVAGTYSRTALQFGDITLPAPSPSSAWHFFVVKFSPDGVVQWAQAGVGSYDGTSIRGLALDGVGNLVLGANTWDQVYTMDGVQLPAGTFLIKLDPDGEVLRSNAMQGNMFAVDREGSVFAAGDWTLIKYRPDGTKEWEWTSESPAVLGGFGGGYYGGIGVDSEGNCILSGTFRSQSSPDGVLLPFGELTLGDTVLTTVAANELVVAKVSRDGDLLWATQSEGQDSMFEWRTRYNLGDTSLPYSTTIPDAMTVSPSGSIIIAGTLGGAVRFGSNLIEGPDPVIYDGIVGVGTREPVFATRLIDPETARPTLNTQQIANALRLSWPVASDGLVLESADTISSETWSAVATTPVVEGEAYVVTIETASGSRFYRLRKP